MRISHLLRALVLAMAASLLAGAAYAAPAEKLTICHAAGRDGTTHFVELTIPPNAVFGKNGNSAHFNEDGTAAAGHEQDTLGPCDKQEPPPPPKGDDPPPKGGA